MQHLHSRLEGIWRGSIAQLRSAKRGVCGPWYLVQLLSSDMCLVEVNCNSVDNRRTHLGKGRMKVAILAKSLDALFGGFYRLKPRIANACMHLIRAVNNYEA